MRRPRLLIALLLAASVLVDLAVLLAARRSEVGNVYPIIQPAVVLDGLRAGQVSLIAMWLALGRTPGWLRLMATVAVIAAWECAFRCAYPSALWWWMEISAGQVIAVAVPLLITRLFGLQLVNLAVGPTAEQPAARRRFQFSILDLLGWMTAVAVTLGMFKLMWARVDFPGVLLSWDFEYVVVIGTDAAVAPAGLWTALGTRRFPLRVAVLMLTCFAAICGTEVCFGVSVPDVYFYFCSLILTLLGSLAVVRVAGYRIVRAAAFPPLPPGTQSEGV